MGDPLIRVRHLWDLGSSVKVLATSGDHNASLAGMFTDTDKCAPVRGCVARLGLCHNSGYVCPRMLQVQAYPSTQTVDDALNKNEWLVSTPYVLIPENSENSENREPCASLSPGALAQAGNLGRTQSLAALGLTAVAGALAASWPLGDEFT